MKTSINYLPEQKRDELRRIVKCVLEVLPGCEMIILYGSYARNTYVDYDQRIEYGIRTCFMSDYDILVVTNTRFQRHVISHILSKATDNYYKGMNRNEAARGGLERTLMEKVVSNKPAVVSLLKVQYRMHEEIMKFPSQWFYNGELEAASEVRYRGILDWDTPIHWIDTSEMDFKEEFVGETFGRINKAEADLLLSELKIYINRISGNRILEEKIDFGIISPYKAQVQYLRNKIKADASLKPYRSLFTVNTVDGFQGQERDVIFISLVRANEEGQIGFLNDLRRMNVAITRARMKLVILGEAETLKHHGFYRKLLEFIQNIGNQ